MLRHRVQTREARGSEDGFGGSRRRISRRRSSLSSRVAGAGEELVLSSWMTLDTGLPGLVEDLSLLASTHDMLGIGSALQEQEKNAIINGLIFFNQYGCKQHIR
jgi:hypothetical protein